MPRADEYKYNNDPNQMIWDEWTPEGRTINVWHGKRASNKNVLFQACQRTRGWIGEIFPYGNILIIIVVIIPSIHLMANYQQFCLSVELNSMLDWNKIKSLNDLNGQTLFHSLYFTAGAKGMLEMPKSQCLRKRKNTQQQKHMPPDFVGFEKNRILSCELDSIVHSHCS